MMRLRLFVRRCSWLIYFMLVFLSMLVVFEYDGNMQTLKSFASGSVNPVEPSAEAPSQGDSGGSASNTRDVSLGQDTSQIDHLIPDASKNEAVSMSSVTKEPAGNVDSQTVDASPEDSLVNQTMNIMQTTPTYSNDSDFQMSQNPEKKIWSFSQPNLRPTESFNFTYDFQPYTFPENELDGKDTMDYVKGIGYRYIYNNISYVDHDFNNGKDRKIKTILLWNSFYDDVDYKFGIGPSPFRVHMCIVNKCRTTTNRNEIRNADMVIFFIFGLDFTRPGTIPPRGHPDQLFVFWNHESPFYKTRNKLRRFANAFNLTVSYRTDSSIPLPLYQTRARVMRKLKPVVTKYHLRNKKKLAVWMISACHKIGSLRLPYEKELERHIVIDTYGACGNYSCPMNLTQECLTDMERDYKFYLAFENSMCEDYITEKAFRTLYGNWVPVVMGGGDYVRHLPPHSFIDVRDFESPRHLAEYLMYLDQNDDEYLKYFDWKKDWIVWRVHTKVAMCELCEILHKGSPKIRSDLDIHDWWEVAGNCVQPEHLKRFLNFQMM